MNVYKTKGLFILFKAQSRGDGVNIHNYAMTISVIWVKKKRKQQYVKNQLASFCVENEDSTVILALLVLDHLQRC